MWRKRVLRVLASTGVATVAAGALSVTNALASGYGQGNYDAGGIYANQVGVDTSTIGGYNPSPSAYDTTSGAVPGIHYNFTVHRFTGDHHVPSSQAISIPDNLLRVVHVTLKSGDANFAKGDPNTAGQSEAWLLGHATDYDETNVVSTQTFPIDLPAAQATKDFAFTVTIPNCGYYEIDSGRHETAGNHANQFATLTAGFVRATGCQGSGTGGTGTGGNGTGGNGTGGNGSGVQAAHTPPTPPTGAGDIVSAEFWNGLLLIGFGMVLTASALEVVRRQRRREDLAT